jgi:hypothetical protein
LIKQKRVYFLIASVLLLALMHQAEATFLSTSQIADNSAQGVPNTDRIVCSERGSLWIKGEPYSFVKGHGLVKAKHGEKDYFLVNGTFVDQYGELVVKDRQGYSPQFVSKEGIFREKGIYDIMEIYPDGEIRGVTPTNCPGFTYSCADIELGINDCYTNQNGQFTLNFYATGLSQGIELDLTKNVLYDIKGTKRSWAENNLPKDVQITRLENNTYELKFYSNDSMVKSVRMRVNGCDAIFNQPLNLNAYSKTNDYTAKCKNITVSDARNGTIDEIEQKIEPEKNKMADDENASIIFVEEKKEELPRNITRVEIFKNETIMRPIEKKTSFILSIMNFFKNLWK